ncbi:FAD-binding oxidoreductase [Rhizobium sp. AG855]|uniref:FAD-binding oxidoreductase n=1 Tax=Rhizobium sp. AG855 TaxID=2183898 RepID=UPI000E71379B|nr:FAD-binding oxidoreductase [Rhizobium sp. AG855]RKE77374.1 FAD/FMN-containing dehydrogenase [Rhizobium sp. AG855]
MSCLTSGFKAEIATIVGRDYVKENDAVSAIDYGILPENLGAGIVVLPGSTEELAAVVRCCHANSVPIVTHGGRTGLVGGGISRPGEIIISTARLNRITFLSPVENVAIVEAGVTLQALQEAAGEYGLEPGIDLPSRGSATIGGMTSTNAGGIAAFRYGVMRHRILGLEAVLADGSIYSDLTRVVKNTAGYDLSHLFIGSEGTLGIITRIAIKLEPRPSFTATALFGLPSTQAALSAMQRGLKARHGHLRAAEAIWPHYFYLTSAHHNWSAADYRADHPINLLLCIGGNDDADVQSEIENIYEDVATDYPDISAVIASSKAQEKAIWALREDTDLIYRKYPGAPSYDVSVPLSELENYLDQCMAKLKTLDPDLSPYVFGHLGDGNLHMVLNAAHDAMDGDKVRAIEEIFYTGLHALGGTFSAEHGIGSKRAQTLIAQIHHGKWMLMRQLKWSLDPTKTLNPGKVLTD